MAKPREPGRKYFATVIKFFCATEKKGRWDSDKRLSKSGPLLAATRADGCPERGRSQIGPVPYARRSLSPCTRGD